MSVDIKHVSALRNRTGAGMMDAKKALEQADGDMEKAVDILRKSGAAKAAKKADRISKEGLVESYIHANGKVGTMVVLNCETDFVARTDKFRALAKDLAMHVAAASPEYLRIEDIPADILAKEKEIYMDQARGQGKPEAMLAKIAEGMLQKFYADRVLLKQPFVKDDSKTVEELVQNAVAVMGEKIELTKFTRFTL